VANYVARFKELTSLIIGTGTWTPMASWVQLGVQVTVCTATCGSTPQAPSGSAQSRCHIVMGGLAVESHSMSLPQSVAKHLSMPERQLTPA